MSKKKYIIFGATYYSEMLSYYVERYDQVEVSAFTVDERYRTSNELYGKPLIGFEEIERSYPPEIHEILVALGYQGMNGLRAKKFQEVKKKGYKIASFIHPMCHIEDVQLGEGNIILENVSLGYHVKIGDGNILWNGCNISHHCEIGNFNFFAPSSVLAGKVSVKNHCFFGINSTVKGGLVVQPYSLIGAGCYLNQDTEEKGVYVPERSKKLSNKISLDLI